MLIWGIFGVPPKWHWDVKFQYPKYNSIMPPPKKKIISFLFSSFLHRIGRPHKKDVKWFQSPQIIIAFLTSEITSILSNQKSNILSNFERKEMTRAPLSNFLSVPPPPPRDQSTYWDDKSRHRIGNVTKIKLPACSPFTFLIDFSHNKQPESRVQKFHQMKVSLS